MTLLERLLIRHEGLKLKPYFDCCGKFFRLCTCQKQGKLTVGIGRNIEDNGISESEAYVLCDNDIIAFTREALDSLHNLFPLAGEVRQAVIIDMIFNMGMADFLGFKKTIAACEAGDWEAAAHEMVNSEWANQVGERAIELANMLASNEPIDALKS